MIFLKTILLAEDNLQDVELILEALSVDNLANRVAAVKDGVVTMEYILKSPISMLQNAFMQTIHLGWNL